MLSPDILEAVVARAADLYAGEPDAAARRLRLTDEAERIHMEMARFTKAIRHGGPLASLVKELGALEQRRADVLAQLEHLDGLAKAETP